MTIEEKVKKVIEKIKPALQADGGDIEFVSVTPEGVVMVRLQGHCSHCPMSQITLKQGVEVAIKEEIPEIKEVVAI